MPKRKDCRGGYLLSKQVEGEGCMGGLREYQEAREDRG